MAQKMQVEIESKQIAALNKSNHQDTLKVISAIDVVTKSIDRLCFHVDLLSDKLDALNDIVEEYRNDNKS